MTDFLRILLIFVLVLGNALFVAGEYALVSARRSRLQERAEAGSRGARSALRLMDTPVVFISTVQVGITVFGIAMGAVGTPLLQGYFDPIVAAGDRLHALVPDPHLPERRPGRARPEGDRAPAGRAPRGPRWPRRSSCSPGSPSRSSGCCRSRPTASSRLFGVEPGAERRCDPHRGGHQHDRRRGPQVRSRGAGRAGADLQGLRLRREGGRTTSWSRGRRS